MSSAQQSGASAPRVSVVIPTFNRRRLLREAIDAVLDQSVDSSLYEIIVVDNASQDDTPQMMAELQATARVTVRYHRFDEDHGPTHSRNLGVQMARGEIIAFTDSDCRPERDWLEKGLAAFTGDLAFITGSVKPKPDQRVRFFSGFQHVVTEEHASYPTCNAMYRRSVFLGAGGFDETLYFTTVFSDKPVECSDTDLAWRIKDSGGRNAFVRDMVVYHDVGVRRAWEWIVDPFRLFSLPALIKKHPRLRSQLLHAKLFFLRETPFFYLAIAAILLGAFVHPALFALALPYPVALAVSLGGFGLRRLPKTLVQVVLLSARQTFAALGLLYGSIRFRALVL